MGSPRQSSLALSLLSFDERSIAGTGAAVAGAAVGAAAVGVEAAEGVPAAEGVWGSTSRDGSHRTGPLLVQEQNSRSRIVWVLVYEWVCVFVWAGSS